MGEVSREGRTVVFVSHNMFAVSRLCRKCMYLKNGELMTYGESSDVIAEYLSDTKGKGGEISWENGFSDPGISDFRLYSVKFVNARGRVDNKFSVLDEIRILADFEVDETIPNFQFKINIRSSDGITIMSFVASNDTSSRSTIDPGRYHFNVIIPAKRINYGSYNLSLACSSKNSRFLARLEDFLDFDVDLISRGNSDEPLETSPGIIFPDARWSYTKQTHENS